MVDDADAEGIVVASDDADIFKADVMEEVALRGVSDLQRAACAVVPEYEIAEKQISRNHVEGTAGFDRHTVIIAFHECVFHKQILAGTRLNAIVVLNPGNALVVPDGAVLHAADDEVPELRIVEERAVIKQILRRRADCVNRR